MKNSIKTLRPLFVVALFVLLSMGAYKTVFAYGDITLTLTDELGNALTTGAHAMIWCTGGATSTVTNTVQGSTLVIASTTISGGPSCGNGDVLHITPWMTGYASTTGGTTSGVDYASGYASTTYYAAAGGSATSTANNPITATLPFQLKVVVADELGNSMPANTLTFDGYAKTATSSNTYYFAQVGQDKVVILRKNGFVYNSQTNTGLGDVSLATSSQTVITLGATSSSAVAIAGGSSWFIKGLTYPLKSNLLQTELSENITDIAAGNPTATSSDVVVTGFGGFAVAGTAVSSNVLYIALSTSSADTVGGFVTKLLNVTAGSGTANGAAFVVATTTDPGHLVYNYGTSTQQTFGIGPSASATFSNTTGFQYPLKVTLTDELGNSLTPTASDPDQYNSVAAYAYSGSSVYFANTASAATLQVQKDGYVDSGTTNSGFSSVTTDTVNQTAIALGTGSAASSVTTDSSANTGKGLLHALKVSLTRSDTGAILSGATVGAGDYGQVSCSEDGTSANYYCAIPVAQTGNRANSSKTGYLSDAFLYTDRTAATDAQGTVSGALTPSASSAGTYSGSGGTSGYWAPSVVPTASPTASPTVAPTVAGCPAGYVCRPTVAASSGPKSASGSSISFTRRLIKGVSGDDVKSLQVILNSNVDTQIASTGAGSPGNETNLFGGLTMKAVQKFQVKYGIAHEGDQGYGEVGPKTRAKLNELSR